ncbi:adenosylcobinamide-phosphate synthase CbiB [Natronosalvus halobius]|uniref:adenosylcobinamide-phosphate synthase CbiB n=1 Tax=Natronosalvus halobius TaxID=2953746 RepID=UPI00209E6593|nr:adenosylcobinamide-phosphate synthase CbiB [Natronosalvus halobius]USZ71722.1 adenosylcobinamide-phosphate synthase CbiB [Natronosalvus halobius]
MTVQTLAAIGLALSLDLLIGEPPTRLHPVAWLGRLIDRLDRPWSANDRTQRRIGFLIALFVPLFPAVLAGAFVVGTGRIQPFYGAVAAALVLFLTASLRALLDLTRAVLAATESDLETARERVRGLVGRDTDSLTDAEIRSAAIESAAENLADGFAATLLPFALLGPVSLPAAAAAVAWIKGVNTLDSMLGYPSKPIGTASARLDDLVMAVPARVTACCLALATWRPRALLCAHRWARVPDSPNSGWPMATLACALDVRLEKREAYVLNPEGSLPRLEDGRRAVSVVGLAAAALVAVAAVCAASAPTLEALVAPPIDFVATRVRGVVS